MPLLNKNNAPRSRRPSLESLANDTVASASSTTVEHWPSQSSDVSSSGDMPSPEQQDRYHSLKRSSVFKLRSRSNTATSTSSFATISSAMVRLDSSNRNSQDLRQLSGQSLLDLPSGRRPLFARRKTGERRNDQVPLHSPVEEDGLEEGTRRKSVLRKGRRNTNQSNGSHRNLKHRISSPFDFQHLTHTDRDQVNTLEQASEHDLAAEFCAMRTSQMSQPDPNGTRATDLHFTNFSSENLTTQEARSKSALGLRSPPLSPHSPYEPQRQQTSPFRTPGPQTIRPSRSVDSFSQPGVYSRAHRHTQSATPSPRLPSPGLSSRPSYGALNDLDEETSPTTRRTPMGSRSHRNSGVWDLYAPLATPHIDSRLPTIADEADNFGTAVTTPDDSAVAISPSYSPELANVEEEPERFSSPRPAPAPPSRSIQTPRSQVTESKPFSNTECTLISPSNSTTSSSSSPRSTRSRAQMARPMSQMSDTLGSSVPAWRHSIRQPPTVRRQSNTWRAIEESWEDDVDYIYDNALEADCDSDWQYPTDQETDSEDRDRTPEQRDHNRPSTAISHRTNAASVSEDETSLHAGLLTKGFRPSLLVPCPSSLPELESRSAISASTADTGIQTPSDFFTSLQPPQAPYVESEGLVLTPSLLIPPEYKETETARDEMYNDIIADYEGSDRHFPILDTNPSGISSSRSSHVRSSKRSSYDSSLMSSGQGSVSWNSPIRRSASSSGSLPELIHSRRSRRELNISVEQLSEQMSSFGAFEEDPSGVDEDDATPPGRVVRDKTFFAADDEDQASLNLKASVESEVRASLELARRGSARSGRAPVSSHKYAASDGAAKLLASPLPATPELHPPPKSRARAASSSNGARVNRRPYLSLFPAPPKQSPLATPTSPLSSTSYPSLP